MQGGPLCSHTNIWVVTESALSAADDKEGLGIIRKEPQSVPVRALNIELC